MTLSEVPYLEQWFGLWAMRESEFNALAHTCRSLNLSVHLAGPQPGTARAAEQTVTIADNVALIEMRGRMQKQQASLGQAASTVAVRRAIRAAAADDTVGAIMLVIDSPGGTVAGTQDLAGDVAAATRVKPVTAYVEDIGASAAYWVASQASKVYAGPTAAVGSIGTYGVVYDTSAMAAMEGVKVHVVRAGQMKGAGTPGTEVTPEQLADYQREVDTLNEFFLQGVSAGRKLDMESVRKLATGQVWIGQQAVDAGLIDGVRSFDAAFLETAASVKQRREARRMAAATYQEIVAACPGATPDFICDQLKTGASVEQATKDFMAWQALQIEQARREAAEARATAERSRHSSAGVEPLQAIAPVNADIANARDEWESAVAAKVKAGVSRPRAVAAVARENPKLREEMLAAVNAGRRR